MKLSRALTEAEQTSLRQFTNARHCKLNLENLPEGSILYGHNEIGEDGMFYIPNPQFVYFANENKPFIANGNRKPGDIPTLYCPFTVYKDEIYIDGEIDYLDEAVEWLEWLIKYFFEPLGISVDGDEKIDTESGDSRGTIVCKDNKVSLEFGLVVDSLREIPTDILRSELMRRYPIKKAINGLSDVVSNYNLTVLKIALGLTEEPSRIILIQDGSEMNPNYCFAKTNAPRKIVEDGLKKENLGEGSFANYIKVMGFKCEIILDLSEFATDKFDRADYNEMEENV